MSVNKRHQRRYNQNKLLAASDKKDLHRKESKKAHFKLLQQTEKLLQQSEELFTTRRWDESSFLKPKNTTLPVLNNEIIEEKIENATKEETKAKEQNDFIELNHFAFRKKNIESKILELKESYKRLDVRSTIDKPPESEMEEEPPEFVSDSSLWTKNESNELFARLVQDTKMIAFPSRAGQHVTVLTAAHRQLEAPMSSKNDFILPDPIVGPRMLDQSRHSLSSSMNARLAGSIARAGGKSVTRPNRYSAHLTSRLTKVRHMTFLPPLYGNNEISSSTSHEERERIMLRQMRNAAARMIQRMWNHRTGIMALLQKIKKRKELAIKEALRLKQEILDDQLQAKAMFVRPTWASFSGEEDSRTARQRRKNRSKPLPTPTSPHSPFTKSFKKYRNMKHMLHTLTLHPKHTMTSKAWNKLNRICYNIVFHDAEDKKPVFTKSHMKKWLTKLYKIYALAPEHMTIGYNEDAAEYWGVVDVNKFAEATHFEPAENIVRILKVMADKDIDLNNKHHIVEYTIHPNGSVTMPFPTFAKSLVKLCCLSTVDLVAFFTFVVNEEKQENNVMHGDVNIADYVSPRHEEKDGREGIAGEVKNNVVDEEHSNENNNENKSEDSKENNQLGKVEEGKKKEGKERTEEEKSTTTKEEKTEETPATVVVVVVEEEQQQQEEEEEETLGATQRRLEKLLCQIHRGHGNADDLTDQDFVEGPSGYSWAVDLEDMAGIVHRTLAKTRRNMQAKGHILGPSDLLKLLISFPIFSYPCLYMQRCLRRRIFGEIFWSTFDMCHHREGLPIELGELSERVEAQRYHFMTLRHAWAETTRYIMLDSLGVNVASVDKETTIEQEKLDEVLTCCVKNCNITVNIQDADVGLCSTCELKGIGLIANSVGLRVAQRFRERTKYFSKIKMAPTEGIPNHNKWLLMRDKLSKSNFYYNGETAARRWVLKARTVKNHDIQISKEMYPRKKKKRKKKRSKKMREK